MKKAPTVERKRMDFLFPETFVLRVRQSSAEREISMSTLVILAVNAYLAKEAHKNVK